MGALSNASTLARNAKFQDICLAALVFQARIVITENPQTPHHEQRAMYARAVINSPEMYMPTVAWVTATDPAVASIGSEPDSIPESTILTSVLAAWNYLAGFQI